MAGADQYQIDMCNQKAARGVTIKLNEGTDPNRNGAGVIVTTPASYNTSWNPAAAGSGADAGWAVASGSTGELLMPPNKTASRFSVWNGSTFLYDGPLDSPITTNAGSISVNVTPRIRFKENN